MADSMVSDPEGKQIILLLSALPIFFLHLTYTRVPSHLNTKMIRIYCSIAISIDLDRSWGARSFNR